jgi:hypothetical protein
VRQERNEPLSSQCARPVVERGVDGLIVCFLSCGLSVSADGLSSKRASEILQMRRRLDLFEGFAHASQFVGYAKPVGFVDMAGVFQESIQAIRVPAPELPIDRLSGLQTGRIPITR